MSGRGRGGNYRGGGGSYGRGGGGGYGYMDPYGYYPPPYYPGGRGYGRGYGGPPSMDPYRGGGRGGGRRDNNRRRPPSDTRGDGGSYSNGSNSGNTNEVLKVAGTSNAKSLAGAIAKRMREGGNVKAVALGAASVNQAIKAFAIARTYLERDNLDLTVRPEFIHIPGKDADEPQRSALRFNIVPRPPAQQHARDDKPTELKVAANTSPMSAAGAVAKRVREGKKCVVVAMGAESVNQAVKSVAIARNYLEDNMLDINFKPKFIHVDMGGDEVKSAVEMTILINQLG